MSQHYHLCSVHLALTIFSGLQHPASAAELTTTVANYDAYAKSLPHLTACTRRCWSLHSYLHPCQGSPLTQSKPNKARLLPPSLQVACLEGTTLRKLAACNALEVLVLQFHYPPDLQAQPRRGRPPTEEEQGAEVLLRGLPSLAAGCKQLRRLSIWLSAHEQATVEARSTHQVSCV